jgi:hypothetical protein
MKIKITIGVNMSVLNREASSLKKDSITLENTSSTKIETVKYLTLAFLVLGLIFTISPNIINP